MGAARRCLGIALLLLLAPAAADVGAHHERRVDVLVASPTPVAGVTVLRDDAAWRVDVPEGVSVVALARAAEGAFYLTAHADGAAEPDGGLAFERRSVTLHEGAWIVRVDPALGALARIDVTFDGAVSQHGGASANFTLTDLPRDPRCAAPGACLP